MMQACTTIITLQHLKVKHIKEWQSCEDERKEALLVKKRKHADNTQPTLAVVIRQREEYPSI